MAVIKVPDIPGPTQQLCWKQAPTMERCDRRLGHGGMHVWAMWNEIQRLEALLVDAGVTAKKESV